MEDPPGDPSPNGSVNVQLPPSLVGPLFNWLSTQSANAIVTATHSGEHNLTGTDLSVPIMFNAQEPINRSGTVSEETLAKVRNIYHILKHKKGLKAPFWSSAETSLKSLIQESTHDLNCLIDALKLIDDARRAAVLNWGNLLDIQSIFQENLEGNGEDAIIRFIPALDSYQLVSEMFGCIDLLTGVASPCNGGLSISEVSLQRLLGIDPKVHSHIAEMFKIPSLVDTTSSFKDYTLSPKVLALLASLLRTKGIVSQLTLAQGETDSLRIYMEEMMEKAPNDG